MKTTIVRSCPLWQRLFLGLLAFALIGAASPLHAGTGARKLLKLELSEDGRTATVEVPRGFVAVTLQQFNRADGWRKIATKDADSKVVKFKLPTATSSDVRWRVIGRFENNASQEKFPAAFYKGKNSFGLQKNKAVGGYAWPAIIMARDLTEDGGESIIPEEADIWKTDGSTVYFFNQLRGLQVLDISDPADPRLIASLRMPAVGEDLYLLGGSGQARHLVLLTQIYGDKGTMTRINLVKVEAGTVEITHHQDVAGSLSDSRMANNRLILVTASGSAETSKSVLSQWLINPGQAPMAAEKFAIAGDYPLIASGANWLAVAATPPGEWGFSEVTVFGLENSGLVRLNATPIRTAGVVADQFKIQWRNHILTTISEKNRNRKEWSPVTVLENFRVWGAGVIPPMVLEGDFGKLRLAEGESLFATRFDGDKAYIVTFLQTDPLWIVNLSDPRKPEIAGHLEVPGWSSHLEPLGDLLLSIGWESNTIAASLFDVANPAAPKLLRRLNLGAPGSYSEAAWDEKALKVLPDAGLVMVPLTSYDEKSAQSTSVVQLLDLDLTKRDLIQRGTIAHEFDARRSEMIDGSVVSISQRVMVAADVEDRDQPSILSEVSLAWPVDRVLDGGTHLLQIEAGSGYDQNRATVRVSGKKATESVFSETDLGKGTVKGADFLDDKLFILREVGLAEAIYSKSSVIDTPSVKLVLDVYDASALPSLTLLGSVFTRVEAGLQVAGNGLLWPQPNRPSVVLDAQSTFWSMGYPVASDTPVSLKSKVNPGSRVKVDRFPFWRPRTAPRVISFDVSEATAPSVGEPAMIGTVETIPNGIYQASNGLIVIGAGNWKNEATGEKFPIGKIVQAAHVVEVPPSGAPLVRPGIDLPGELFAVSQLDQDGFLAFTRNFESDAEPAIKVSACDGFDAFEITGLDEKPEWVATAGGRRLFIVKQGGVERHRLTDEGTFATETKLETGWNADQLRWSRGILLGSKWNALFAAEDDSVLKWKFPTWSPDLDQISVAGGGDLLVPFGEYGAERLDR